MKKILRYLIPATLSLLSGTSSLTYTPDPNNAASGVISLAESLDYETLGNYVEIAFKAEDSLGNQHGINGRKFRVYISNEDDTPPNFTSSVSIQVESVAEENDVIHTATAVDAADNGGSNPITYALLNELDYDKYMGDFEIR